MGRLGAPVCIGVFSEKILGTGILDATLLRNLSSSKAAGSVRGVNWGQFLKRISDDACIQCWKSPRDGFRVCRLG